MSEKSKRSNYMKQSGVRGMVSWCILALFLVKMIYLSYQTGMNGITFYAFADVVFIMLYVMLGISVVPVLKKMILFQINHGNYKNASKVYRVIGALLLVVSLVVSGVLLVFSSRVSVIIFQTKLCSFLFKLVAAALFCWIVMSALKGYLEGLGNAMPGICAEVFAHATSLVVTMIAQPVFAENGRKVAAVMRQDSYAYAYAACSGMLGLAIGGLVGVLFMLLVCSLFGKEIRRRVRSDETRKTDSAQDILWNFSGNWFKNVATENIGIFLACVLYVLYAHLSGNAEDGAGVIYIGMVVPGIITALLATQISAPYARQLTSIMKQADFHHAKERMRFYLKLLSYTILPLVIVGCAVAPLLSDVFFDVEQDKLSTFIRIGMINSALVAYGIFFRRGMSIVVKPYLRNICAGLLGVSGIAFLYVLKFSGMTDEKCAAYAYVLACLMYVLVSAFLVLKKIRIYNSLLDSFVVPMVASAMASAVVFGIYILLEKQIPAGILLVLAVLIAYVVYHAIIVFLHVFEKYEWKEVPASDIPVMFAKLIGKY